MSEVYEKLMKCYKSVREKTDFVPEAALILGSGLGDYADDLKIEASINYADIEGFPVSTVKGHKGRFVFAHVEGVPMVIMQGRVHYYEGYPMSDVVLPTRLMGLLGAKKIILTNAAGGVNYNFKPGDFMLITDHITTAVPNPLIGENIDELGTRFPDMSEVYAPELQEKVRKAAEKLQINLCHSNGVHDVGLAGTTLNALMRLVGKVECFGYYFDALAVLGGQIVVQQFLECLFDHFLFGFFLFLLTYIFFHILLSPFFTSLFAKISNFQHRASVYVFIYKSSSAFLRRFWYCAIHSNFLTD